jgi:hypothetical protein
MIPCRIGITENRLLITQNSKDVDCDCYDDTTKEPMRNKEPNSNMNSYIQNLVTYYVHTKLSNILYVCIRSKREDVARRKENKGRKIRT